MNSVSKPVVIKYLWRAWSLSHPLITQRIQHPTGPLRHSFNPIPKPQIWVSPPATSIDLVTTGVHRCSNVVTHWLKAFLSFRTKEISSVGSGRGRIAVYVMSSRCLICHLLFAPEMSGWIRKTSCDVNKDRGFTLITVKALLSSWNLWNEVKIKSNLSEPNIIQLMYLIQCSGK